MNPSRLLVLSAPNPISRDVGFPVRLRCPRMYRKSHDLVTLPFLLAATCKYRPPPSAYLPGLSIVSMNFGLSKLSRRAICAPSRTHKSLLDSAGSYRTCLDTTFK